MSLPKPKLVTQVNPVTCWAASMESWTGAVRGTAVPQAGFIPLYGMANGGLSTTSVFVLAKDYSLQIETVATNPDWAEPRPAWPISRYEKFSSSLVDDLLTTRKHLLLCYHLLGSTWLHVVVIYGVTGDKFSIMNPAVGTGFLSVESSYFFPNFKNVAYLLFSKK